MRASELIEELRQAVATHGDLEIRATWEGITRKLDAPCVHRIDARHVDQRPPALGELFVLNADGPSSHEELAAALGLEEKDPK